MSSKSDYYKQSQVYTNYMGTRTPVKGKFYQDIDEEKFFDYIKQKYGEGTDFYDQALNAYNSYKSKTWSPNVLQDFVAGWGDVSGFQNWQNDRLSIFEDALSRIGDASHQESYNSAIEQVARQRAAGLNPDLTGGVDSGEAGNLDNLEAARAPQNDTSSAQQVVNFAAQMPLTFLNGVLELYSGVQDISMGNLQIASQDIANNNAAMKFVLDSLANSYLRKNPDKPIADLSDVSSLLDESSKVDYSGYHRSTRKLIQKFFNGYRDNVRKGEMPLGLQERIARLRGSTTRENWQSAHTQGNPLWSDDFDQMVLDIATKFGDLPNLVEQLSMEAEALESGYNADYYGTADGVQAAKAENEANILAEKSNQHQQSLIKTEQEIDKIFKDVEDKLKSFANSGKRGSVFGLLGLLLLPTLKNQVYQGINIQFPSLHINASKRNSQIINTDNRTSNYYRR